MDVSIASADERPDAAPGAVEDKAPAAPATRRSPVLSRRAVGAEGGLDPALVFKIGKIAGAVLLVILVIWGLVALFSGDSSDTPKSGSALKPAAVSPASTERTITLVALDTVRVSVTRKNADASHGEVLFQGTLVRNQTQVVPKPGPIYITANKAENLEIEYLGKRYPTGFTGNQAVQMQ